MIRKRPGGGGRKLSVQNDLCAEVLSAELESL